MVRTQERAEALKISLLAAVVIEMWSKVVAAADFAGLRQVATVTHTSRQFVPVFGKTIVINLEVLAMVDEGICGGPRPPSKLIEQCFPQLEAAADRLYSQGLLTGAMEHATEVSWGGTWYMAVIKKAQLVLE